MSERIHEHEIDHHGDTPVAPCPTCGVLVQVRAWYHKDGWRALPTPVSTALGLEHSAAAGTCQATEGIVW